MEIIYYIFWKIEWIGKLHSFSDQFKTPQLIIVDSCIWECFQNFIELATVCSLGEVKKFLLISWAWKVRGSSGGWQTFNDTWTFDEYISHCTTDHFYF